MESGWFFRTLTIFIFFYTQYKGTYLLNYFKRVWVDPK